MQIFRKLALLIILGLTACTVPPDATLKHEIFNGDQVIATDARLRIVNKASIADQSIPGEVDPSSIICTEPSPDVATVIANSFGSSFKLFNYGNASISSEHVEGLVQLGERTATIQLLRDKMYQTCLAYANGAISGTTYSFIMSRLDDTIVTLLLGETAGGAFGRELGSIGGKAEASVSATLSSLPDNIANLDKRIVAMTAAAEELRTAEKDLANHNAITPTPETKEAHDARTTDLEAIVEKAKGKRDAVQRLMKNTMETANKSAAEISKIKGDGRLYVTPDSRIAETLGDMQAEFLLQDVSSSVLTACLVELGRKFGAQKDGIPAAEVTKAVKASTDKIIKAIKACDDKACNDKIAAGTLTAGEQAVDIKRFTGSALAEFCTFNLMALIQESSKRNDKFRTHKVERRASVKVEKYRAQFAASSAIANKTFVVAKKECESIEDLDLQKACLKKLFEVPD